MDRDDCVTGSDDCTLKAKSFKPLIHPLLIYVCEDNWKGDGFFIVARANDQETDKDGTLILPEGFMGAKGRDGGQAILPEKTVKLLDGFGLAGRKGIALSNTIEPQIDADNSHKRGSIYYIVLSLPTHRIKDLQDKIGLMIDVSGNALSLLPEKEADKLLDSSGKAVSSGNPVGQALELLEDYFNGRNSNKPRPVRGHTFLVPKPSYDGPKGPVFHKLSLTRKWTRHFLLSGSRSPGIS